MSRDVLLRLEQIAKTDGDDLVLSEVSAEFQRGEMTVILGGRGSGLGALGALIAGQRLPDRGRVWRGGVVAPPVGVPWGFGVAGTVERDLALRAAAFGLDTGDYVGAIAALLDRPQVLHLPFAELPAQARYTVVFAASYLIPADIYVIDGAPVPITTGAWGEIEALFGAIRADSAVIWLAGGVSLLRRFEAERFATLKDGRLTLHRDKDSALTSFARDNPREAEGPGPLGRAQARQQNPADEPEDEG